MKLFSKALILFSSLYRRRDSVRYFCKGDCIGKGISLYGHYEYFQLRVFEKYILQPLLAYYGPLSPRQDSVFVDVGANIGNHTSFFSSFFNFCVLIEPNPIAFGVLQANVDYLSSSTSSTYILSDYALSNSEKTCVFYQRSQQTHGSNIGNSSLHQDFVGAFSKAINVQAAKGDALISSLGILSPDCFLILKIDVEGHEQQVLDGFELTINKYRPIIWLELGSAQVFTEVKKLSSSQHYDILGIEAVGPRNPILRAACLFPYALSVLTDYSSRVYADVFLVPSEKTKLFGG